MKQYASVFKTSLGLPRSSSHGWAALIFNEKDEVVRFILPTTRQKALSHVKGVARKRFPSVEAKVRDYFDGKRVSFDQVAISRNGSGKFESRVYQALRKVPYGAVLSYSQLAAKAGSKNAARAAGHAMSKNRIPLLIPCHRVIKADGSVGKFTADGGTALKKKMLALEAAAR